MKLSKEEIEWFLAEIFKRYHKKVEIIKKRESPDFICINDEGKTIGLETTQSMTSTYGRMEDIYDKYSGRGLSAEEIKRLISDSKKESKFLEHGDIKESEKLIYFIPNRNLIDTSCSRDELIKIIEKKTMKLNENFDLYDKNALIVYPRNCFLSNYNDCNEVLKALNELITRYKYKFDYIYIFNFDRLHVCTIDGDAYTMNEITVNSGDIVEIEVEAIKSLINWSQGDGPNSR